MVLVKLDSITVTVGHKLSRNYNTVGVSLSAVITPGEGDKMPEVIDTTFQFLRGRVTREAAEQLEIVAPEHGNRR